MEKPTIYRKPMGENLFEEEFTVEALSKMGNPLERLSSLVDFEMFRQILEDVLLTKECKTPAGRKPIDVVLMFKVILLQRCYGPGRPPDSVSDNLSAPVSASSLVAIRWLRFHRREDRVGLSRHKLSKAGTSTASCQTCSGHISTLSLGLSCNEGKIMDATFVEAPGQRNSPVGGENGQIKAGNGGRESSGRAAAYGEEALGSPRGRSLGDVDASLPSCRQAMANVQG